MKASCWMTLAANSSHSQLSQSAQKRGAELILFLFFLTILFGAGCSDHTAARQQISASGLVMGTSWSVKIVDFQPKLTTDQLQELLQAELDRLNLIFSTYDDNAELAILNTVISTEPQVVSAELFEVLEHAVQISGVSGGAFDVTVGPLVNLWGFGRNKQQYNVPEQAVLDATIKAIGFRKLLLDSEQLKLRKLVADINIDLSAIAKGYAVDKLAILLEKLGAKEYLVEVGGELLAKGNNAQGLAWRIGIEAPTAEIRQVYKAVNLKDMAIATSGDYRNFIEIDGQRYSHTIDPRTASPVQHSLASVAVISVSAMDADAWATALLVMGEQQGFQLAEQLNISALFISRTAGGYAEQATSAFSRRLK